MGETQGDETQNQINLFRHVKNLLETITVYFIYNRNMHMNDVKIHIGKLVLILVSLYILVHCQRCIVIIL